MKEGDGDEERGQESMKGRIERGVVGMGRNGERKMIVCMCQWELNPLTDSMSAPLILSQAKSSSFLQSFRDTHLHRMKILVGVFLYVLLLLGCFVDVLCFM